jgi:hypothetical protein
MMIRLVLAQAWRIRLSLFTTVMWGALGSIPSTGLDARWKMGIPLVFAAVAITGLGMFWGREVRVLPISRRMALRSAWLAAAALPVAILAGRLIGGLTHVAFDSAAIIDIEAIALASVWHTVFIGMSLTLMQRPDAEWVSVRQAISRTRESGKLVLSLVWMLGVPFASPELVPQSFDDVTWVHLAGVLVGICVTVWPLVTAPDQWPILGVLHDAPSDLLDQPRRFERDYRALDQLAGMRRLLPGPVGTAALVAALTLAASTVLVASLRSLQSPFAAGMPDMEFFLVGGPLFLLVLGPFVWANGLSPYLRRLRALPVSALQIAVTMTMLPVMMPVFFWCLAMAVHLVIGVSGETSWRLGSFLLVSGVMALSGAVHARLNSVGIIAIGWAVPVIGVLTLMMFFDKVAVEPVIAVWFPIVGLIGVPAAFLLNYRTVTRGSSSSAAYRPAPGESLYRGSRP